MQSSFLMLIILGGLIGYAPLAEAQLPNGRVRVNSVMLLESEKIQREIGLESESLEAVNKLISDFKVKARKQSPSLSTLRAMNREDRTKGLAEIRKLIDELNAEAIKEIEMHLSDQQKLRLDQILLQQKGAYALSEGKVVAKLKLSNEQQQKIADVLEFQDAAWRKVMGKIGTGGQRRFTQVAEKVDSLRNETSEKLMAILTDVQKANFTEMKGEPFALDRRDMRRRPLLK